MAAIVGAAGLPSTLAAARAGKRVLLANKESLVVAGPLLVEAARQGGATLIPIDSEHNAIFQCMPPGLVTGHAGHGVHRVLLTASGGPFLRTPVADMARVTPAQACAHPRWNMGRKISVDSASLMNKGLELIEAFHLFPVTAEQIEIVVHPQSIVHSLVAYVDGSVLAQLGTPDMRTPIAYALAWPQRMATSLPRLRLTELTELTFEAPDLERFPALVLARDALRIGGAAPAALNAANEVAVHSFLAREIGFLDIARVVHETLDRFENREPSCIGDIIEIDAETRDRARDIICNRRMANSYLV
jgi:1-deoxy-D-xylulose-5-phosphate reductoisomerase